MGSRSLICAVIRQLVFNIPILIVLDRFFGMNGIIWTQLVADTCTAIASYFIYRSAVKGMKKKV